MTKDAPDPLTKNTQRTAGLAALKQIGDIVAQERETQARLARVLHAFLLYGWLVLLLMAGLLAYWMGVI